MRHAYGLLLWLLELHPRFGGTDNLGLVWDRFFAVVQGLYQAYNSQGTKFYPDTTAALQ